MPPSEAIQFALVVQTGSGLRGAADESGCGPAAACRAIRSGARDEMGTGCRFRRAAVRRDRYRKNWSRNRKPWWRSHRGLRSVEGARKPRRSCSPASRSRIGASSAKSRWLRNRRPSWQSPCAPNSKPRARSRSTRLPIDRILRQRQIPGRAESVLLFEVGHPLHPLEALRTFHVMSEHDAAPRVVGPEADVPRVCQAVDLQALPYSQSRQSSTSALSHGQRGNSSGVRARIAAELSRWRRLCGIRRLT